ncbi:hypothetical protein SNEBB_006030 [Seison nebaliae]|nr:hypothetical protein SNEBB_006030 [Seison nebaliae]
MKRFSGLYRPKVFSHFLHTNSTNHEFVLGAMAEMIDNAHDANATTCYIDYKKLNGVELIEILDNGKGIPYKDLQDVFSFGKTTKRFYKSEKIGCYGNGLKAGSMRLAKDMLLITKAEGVCSLLLLSRTFNEKENLPEICIPIISYSVNTMQPFFSASGNRLEVSNDLLETHKLSLSIVNEHTPFIDEQSIFDQFDKIKTNSGTIVFLFNLKSLENGDCIFTFNFDDDIRLNLVGENGSRQLNAPRCVIRLDDQEEITELGAIDYPPEYRKEDYSLRAYLSILYQTAQMKIFIRNKQILCHQLVGDMAFVHHYVCARTTKFQKPINDTINVIRGECKRHEAEIKSIYGEIKRLSIVNNGNEEKDNDLKIRQLNYQRNHFQEELTDLENHLNLLKLELRKKQPIRLSIGINLECRFHDGVFVYSSNRLIRMYDRYPLQKRDSSVAGIVAVVMIPWTVLEPQQNKQGFLDQQEYGKLLRIVNEHVMNYQNRIKLNKDTFKDFWKEYGYDSGVKDPAQLPRRSSQFKEKRAECVERRLFCQQCGKMRVIPFCPTVLQPIEAYTCKSYRIPGISSCQTDDMSLDDNFETIKPKPAKPVRKEMIKIKREKEDPVMGEMNMDNSILPNSTTIFSDSICHRDSSLIPLYNDFRPSNRDGLDKSQTLSSIDNGNQSMKNSHHSTSSNVPFPHNRTNLSIKQFPYNRPSSNVIDQIRHNGSNSSISNHTVSSSDGLRTQKKSSNLSLPSNSSTKNSSHSSSLQVVSPHKSISSQLVKENDSNISLRSSKTRLSAAAATKAIRRKRNEISSSSSPPPRSIRKKRTEDSTKRPRKVDKLITTLCDETSVNILIGVDRLNVKPEVIDYHTKMPAMVPVNPETFNSSTVTTEMMEATLRRILPWLMPETEDVNQSNCINVDILRRFRNDDYFTTAGINHLHYLRRANFEMFPDLPTKFAALANIISGKNPKISREVMELCDGHLFNKAFNVVKTFFDKEIGNQDYRQGLDRVKKTAAEKALVDKRYREKLERRKKKAERRERETEEVEIKQENDQNTIPKKEPMENGDGKFDSTFKIESDSDASNDDDDYDDDED